MGAAGNGTVPAERVCWPVRLKARFNGWLGECCPQSKKAMATGAELFESYNDYRDSQGLPPVTKRTRYD